MAGKNDQGVVCPNYQAPVVIEQDGKRVLDHLRWGMPSPLLLPGWPVTNVRNTQSGHRRPWLASSSVVVGKEPQNRRRRHRTSAYPV
jgi:putative SOS response-associated peptidase YedK